MSSLSGFNPIVNIMNRIVDSGNKYPKVRLALGSGELQISISGLKSRSPGSVNLTDGGSYPNNKYYGRIMPNGVFFPSEDARNMDQNTKSELWKIMQRMKAGQAEQVFAESGKKLGFCCMCGRGLSNEESVRLGIGPICRDKAFG